MTYSGTPPAAQNAVLVNLTGHDVVLHLPDGPRVTLAPEADVPVPRIDTVDHDVGSTAAGLPIVAEVDAGPVDLPPHEAGVVWIVSRRVLDACPHRCDLAAPGALIRNSSGQVVGCGRLVINVPP